MSEQIEKLLFDYQAYLKELPTDAVAFEIEYIASLQPRVLAAEKVDFSGGDKDSLFVTENDLLILKNIAICEFCNRLNLSSEIGSELRKRVGSNIKIFKKRLEDLWDMCSIPGTVFSIGQKKNHFTIDKRFYFETALGPYSQDTANLQKFIIVFDYVKNGYMYKFSRAEFDQTVRLETAIKSIYLNGNLISYSKISKPYMEMSSDVYRAVKDFIEGQCEFIYKGPRKEIRGMRFEPIMFTNRIWQKEERNLSQSPKDTNFVLVAWCRDLRVMAEFTLHDFFYLNILKNDGAVKTTSLQFAGGKYF